MSYRATKSGLSADTQAKINAKYDPEVASQCLGWIKRMLQKREGNITFDIDGSAENFAGVLRDGLYLCKLINILMPGAVPASKLNSAPKLPFKQMELIGMFVDKIKEFGVSDHEAFQTVDLHESQNLHQVVISLQSLGRKAQMKGFEGFGPKEAEANRRDFTEEQLREGQSIIGLQMGSNKGANQSGMNIGKSRHIID